MVLRYFIMVYHSDLTNLDCVVFWDVGHGDANIRRLDRYWDGWTKVSIKDTSGALEIMKQEELC